MQLLEDAVIAALAAVGLVTLLFLLLTAAALPRRAETDAVALLPCRRGGAAELEQAVRALRRAQKECGAFRRIVLLDLGMDGETKEIAALLCRDGQGMTLCGASELPTIFTQEKTS